MRRGIAISGLSLLLFAGGCLTSTQASRLQTDMDEVKRQIFKVQQETADSRSRLEGIDRKLGEGVGGAGSTQADLQAAVQALLDRVHALDEQLRELRGSMNTLTLEIQAMRRSGRNNGGVAAQPSVASPPAAPPPSLTAGADPSIRMAYADYSRGNYDLALSAFGEFLGRDPNHPQAADAQYWIGECLYSQKRFAEAADAFGKVSSSWPSSERVPAALLKRGLSQMEAGLTTQAVATLQGLIESAPRSDEARLAAERLRQMGLRSHP